jgi:hypothetical protein
MTTRRESLEKVQIAPAGRSTEATHTAFSSAGSHRGRIPPWPDPTVAGSHRGRIPPWPDPTVAGSHRGRIMEKLNLHSAGELVRFAFRNGLIT